MLCPKCRRPLEDEADGPYICCAGASLQWRCMDCAKVSEGFAFPYGRCPHCGGELEVVEGVRASAAAALEGPFASGVLEFVGERTSGRRANMCDHLDM